MGIQRRSKGFSLLELLVVIVIIGFAIGVASPNINPSSATKRLNRQGDLLFARLRFAADEALLSGEAIGLAMEQQEDAKGDWQYSWYRYHKGKWQALEAPLMPTTLPENMVVSMEIEGEPLEDIETERARNESDATEDENTVKPVVVLYPGGEMTEFDINLYPQSTLSRSRTQRSNDKTAYRISINENGELVSRLAQGPS